MAAPKTTVPTVEKEVMSTSMAFSKAAEALLAAVAAAEKIEERVKIAKEAFDAQAATKTAEIDAAKAEIAALTAEYMEKERIAKVDTELKIKEMGISAASTYLGNTHKVLTIADYNAHIKAINEVTANTETAVKQAEQALHARYKGELAQEVSKAALAAAEDKALIKALQAEVKFQATTIASLNEMITAERSASVERAKAAAIGTVSINGGK
jgi:uncharacterized coiled-coil protein SlyX